MSKKYKLNPDYHTDRVRCNGITITSDDILEGDEWFEGTKQPFEHIAPLLVVAPDDAEVTISLDEGPRAPQHPSIEEIAARSGVASVPETEEEEDDEDTASEDEDPSDDDSDPEDEDLDEGSESDDDDDDDEEDEDLPLELTDIKGVGDSRANMLSDAGYKDVEAVAAADPDALMKAVRDLGKPLNLATARSIVKGAADLLED